MKEKPFACTVNLCTKTFSSRFNLKRHIDCIHLGCNRFACEVCGKVLTSKQNYNQHLHIHIGDKPLVCPEPGCGQTFRQGSLLSMHKKVHKIGTAPKDHVECNLNVTSTQLTQILHFSSDSDINSQLSYRDACK